MTIGSLMFDIQGITLDKEEIEILQHPLTGGIILFSRNFQNQAQIHELCKSIRTVAGKPILIAVDHEGGRVQRFQEDFTIIPAMGVFQHRDCDEQLNLENITVTGWLMAAELIASGIDISFAPVLDLDVGISKVIGDRGFSDQPREIIKYATAFIQGMNNAGMPATGKHFPGHGSIVEDSHFDLPVDDRTIQEIRDSDLSVFAALSERSLSAVMPSHVIYSDVDSLPACFSHIWLQEILRNELKFSGTVFSDDLSMEGAKVMGDITARTKQALSAGCDMVLCCNDRDATITLLDQLPQQTEHEKVARIQTMISKQRNEDFKRLLKQPIWQKNNKLVNQIVGKM